MTPIITVNNLGKKYKISHRAGGYVALRDILANIFKNPFRFLKSKARAVIGLATQEEFWALKNINFTVESGEIIGIIGSNGAGKSTLLKILSQITPPTTGEIKINGRVGSLLEVGTGFHPELTGRENIFLNGAILGMTRNEIKNKFAAIVEFAGMEKFLDTPVKYYSSGMYVRLAFAVAAHLEPDILIIDEVLAVGDAEFQKKCLGKMGEITKEEGRTILFVSHNMAAVKQLCQKCILLNQGEIQFFGDVNQAVEKYLHHQSQSAGQSEWVNRENKYQNPYFQLTKFSLVDKNDIAISGPIKNNEEVYVRVEGGISQANDLLMLGYVVYDEQNNLLYWSGHTDSLIDQPLKINNGRVVVKAKLPPRFFNEGVYRFEFFAHLCYQEWIVEPGVNAPSIILDIKGGLSDSRFFQSKRTGVLAPIIDWQNLDH